MISVCMATCNGARFLARQLETIIPQLAPEDELVISDDGSTDDTLAIIAACPDPRIRVLTDATFRNPVDNFEHALKAARGEILVLADQDDVWLPNRLALVRERFAGRPAGPFLLVTDARVVGADEQLLADSLFAILGARPGFLRNLFANRFQGCCLAFSRELLRRALPFPRRLPMHDWWLGLLCELVGTTEFLPTPAILYRKHDASLTDFAIRWRPLTQLRWRLTMVVALAGRLLVPNRGPNP